MSDNCQIELCKGPIHSLHKNQGLVTVKGKPNLELLTTWQKGGMKKLIVSISNESDSMMLREDLIQQDYVLPDNSYKRSGVELNTVDV